MKVLPIGEQNFEKIRQKAVQKGLYSFADAQKLTKGQLLNLIFIPIIIKLVMMKIIF